MGKNKNGKDKKIKTLENIGHTGAAAEAVQRYGSANKEYLVAYSGRDNETGQVLKKGLKSISNSKVNPEYKTQNLKQQAGFSAEVKETARENAERIIKGEKTRVVRTDDLGRVNDPLYDHVVIDSKGRIIDNSGSQMKFVGSDPKAALDKILSSKYEKYLDADVKIEVPSDYYDGIRKEAQAKIKGLQEHAKKLQDQGKTNQANQELAKIEKYKKIKRNLVKSKVSTKEAMEARLHPELSTAKDIIKVSNEAGLEQAGYGAIFGGGTSIIRNFVACVKDEKEIEDAVFEVVKDTGCAAASSYTITSIGSAIKASMQNSSSVITRGLSKTNLPAMLVTLTIESGKILLKYFKGEIDGVQCLEELGEKGTSMTASVLFTVVGQIAIPIPIIGGMIGGMLGYALSSACYKHLLSALKDAKLAKEQRIKIEAECAEAVEMLKQYRAEMEAAISYYLSDHLETFQMAFDDIYTSMNIGDVDGVINGANKITGKLGGKPQFKNMSEFDSFMKSSDNLNL